MYQKSRNILDCHIAGFTYYDGLEVIEEIRLGSPVRLESEPDNPYDPEAVVIYFRDKKIGYIPKLKNREISNLLYFGYRDIFEAKISSINLEAEPEQKLRVVVKLKDNRKG
jgi:hypothetical protein